MSVRDGARLDRYGWDDGWATAFEPFANDGLLPARVAIQHRATYHVCAAHRELEAVLAGRLRHRAEAGEELLPAVGDWVAVRPPNAVGGRTAVLAVLPRRSAFIRKEAGRGGRDQVLAANVDTVFLMSALGADLNPRRLERYLTLAWESGARPVIVLGKADLVGDVDGVLDRVRQLAFDVPIHVVSSVTGQGFDELRPYLSGNRTIAVLGSSGVGKSTLINALAGRELLETGEVRAGDEKGRHTTTRRELVVLPGGGVIVDTPGLRELQLSEAGEGLREAFEDVETLAAGCRFLDCTHASEPGCAVRQAVEDGRLDGARLQSYQKLQRELRALEARSDPRAAAETKRQARAGAKALRARLKEKAG